MRNLFQKTFWPFITFLSCLTLWTSFAFSQANTWPDFRGNMLGVSLSGGVGGTGVSNPMVEDLKTNGFNIVHSTPKTTDTAPDASSMTCGQSSYWNATAGTNATGGACTVSGGIGSRKDAIVAAAIVNDTLVITGTKGGVATSATWTFNAGGIGTCAALTNSQCAVLLVNYCNTNGPALGIASCECSDATCTTPTVGFIPAPDMSRLVLTPSDASQTITKGANGPVLFGKNNGGPNIGWLSNAGTGIGEFSDPYGGDLVLYVNGASKANISTNGFEIYNTYTAFGGNGSRVTAPGASGKFGLGVNNGVTGAGLDATTANRLSVTKLDGTTLGELAFLLVGTVAAVDMSSTARQTLYTVPAGFAFSPRMVSVGPCSAVIDAATGAFGSDTPAADFHAAIIQTHTAADSIAYIFPADSVAIPRIAAAGTFAYDGTIAEGAADTCTMSVYGQLR